MEELNKRRVAPERTQLIPVQRLLTLLIVATLATLTGSRAAAGGDGTDTDQLVQGNNGFAVDLYHQLRQAPDNQDKNLFLSPFSVSSALAMTYAGARGETAEQMKRVLRFDQPAKQVHTAYHDLLQALRARQEKDEVELHIANALWGQTGYDFRDEYLEVTRKQYGAGLKQVDFKRSAEQAREKINTWVAENTRNKIKKLMPKGAITPRTRLALTNAVYFKAQWAHTFNKDATRKREFRLRNGETIQTPMMHQTERFPFTRTDNVKLLEMPYKNRALAMVILLPQEGTSLDTVEDQLNRNTLSTWLDHLDTARVRVAIPKFKLTSRFILNEPLENMGMTDAFRPNKADFSGMTAAPKPRFFLQTVVHKAYVDVYEKGTEAAAATGVSLGVTSAQPEKPETFMADHPFLFILRDRQTESILFIGRVLSPPGSE